MERNTKSRGKRGRGSRRGKDKGGTVIAITTEEVRVAMLEEMRSYPCLLILSATVPRACSKNFLALR